MTLPNINPDQAIAIDLETCDPELRTLGPGYITGIGFVAGIAIKAEEGAWYIPIGHSKGKNYDKDEVVAWLNKTLSGNTEKIFHNAQYDVGWLSVLGVQMYGSIFDTMLAAPLLNENRFSYQLDALGKIYCGEGKFEEALRLAVAEEFKDTRTRKTIIRMKEDSPCYGYQPFVDAKARVTQFYEIWPEEIQRKYDVLGHVTSKNGQELFLVPCKREADIKALLWTIDAEDMGTYPIQDVELTYKLYKIFKPLLEKENLTKLMDLESELILPLLEMRQAGVRIDMEKAIELDKQYTKILEGNQKSLNKLCGFEVDVNIKDDLIKICEKFGLEYSQTEKGNPCFSAEAMPDHDAFKYVDAIREMNKARDTYIRGYIFGSTINGWLHGQYNQLKSDDGGTVTGRLSSSCIAEGTKISVPGGYKNIEDIEVGDVVYCYTEDGKPTVSTVLNKVYKGIHDCVKVRWQSSRDRSTGRLICTPDHWIKTKHKDWTPAGELKRYDKLFSFCEGKQGSDGHIALYVKPTQKHRVWDIEVAVYHNFIANEICVHNCPNMQNMPNPKSSQIGKDIRGLFLPDNDNEEWLSMDYSGQEPKMLVHTVLAYNKFMQKNALRSDVDYVPGAELARTEEFRGRTADFHTAVATICMRREFELMHKEVTEEELKAAAKKFRPKAKSIGLGVMYGSGDQKVADEMTKKGFPMTKMEAHDIRSNIYSGVPFLDYINKELMRRARDRGYIKTVLGRRGRFDLWECPCFNAKDKKELGTTNFGFKTRQEAFSWYNENKDKYEIGRPQRAMIYKALNKYIQGSSADQTKTAMVHLYKRGNLDLNVLDIYYRRLKDFQPPKFKTQVHDEINVSKTKDESAEWYQDIMEHCLPLEVEVVADPVVCNNWAEAK